MKIAKEHLTRLYATFSAVMYRMIPVIIFAFIFSQIAIVIDKNHFREAPATDFLKYTSFTVNNARENENVYFTVCRERISNIHYSGDLNVYVIIDASKSNERKVQVYGRDIGGTIQRECDNRVIRAADFKHEAGTYEMGFCLRFKVKYGFEKEVCKTSNRYRIYKQPEDLKSRIRDLELQLESAREQLADSKNEAPNTESPQSATGITQNSQVYRNEQYGEQKDIAAKSEPSKGGDKPTGIRSPSCLSNLLGIGLVCGDATNLLGL